MRVIAMYLLYTIYYNYKVEKLSVCLSVCIPSSFHLHFWHIDNSAVSAWIETAHVQSKSCVFVDCRVYFNKPTEPTVHWLECIKDKSVSSH